MSDYIRVYNLTLKDSLPTGNSNKVIKGTELDVELNAAAAAIASKADSNDPTFTGTPLAPTASYGTNTTQLATTAFVQAALQALYPVGSVYINATVATNPATLLGFGTWISVGDGRVLVNQDTGDADFDALGDTGGSKSSIAAHTHTVSVSGSTGGAGAHSHSINDPGHVHAGAPAYVGNSAQAQGGPSASYSANTYASTTGISINGVGDHTHSVSASGTTASTGSSNGNLVPYVTVKMWKRTA